MSPKLFMTSNLSSHHVARDVPQATGVVFVGSIVGFLGAPFVACTVQVLVCVVIAEKL